MKNIKPINVFDRFNKIKLLLFFVILGSQVITGQVQNNGTIYLNQNSYLYVNSSFIFGTGSVTKTFRGTGTNHGKLIFSALATTSGAASGAALFVDGFASTRKVGVFDLPTGDGTTYAPVGVNITALINGVDAAYKNENPTTIGTDIDVTITTLSTLGYWIIKGDDAKIKLIWNNDIGGISNSLADVTVSGYKISTSKWEAINCDTPTGNLSSGTITTSSAVVLSNYSAFTIAEKGVACASVFVGTGRNITFNNGVFTTNGTVFPATPTDNDIVTITSAGTPGSFICNSLILDADITLTGTQSIEVVNDVTGSGKIVMSSKSSFVQRKPLGTAPTIELTKTTRSIKRFDYVYLGSPISGDVFSQLANAVATGQTTAAAFDSKYKYVSGVSGNTGGWQNLTATEDGEGFIMRVKEQAPFINSSASQSINLKFTGTANNGTISTNLGYQAGLIARNNNLLANPYPSAIDADKFLTQNSSVVDGVIYLWSANTDSSNGSSYAVGDYIAYTKAGSTAYVGTQTTGFDGKIASGQGFKVRAVSTGTVAFTNCMRVAGDNDQFYRYSNSFTSNTIQKNRFNLNLQTAEGIANQILVAYLPEATLEYDHMYDAQLLSVNATNMYSILDNTTQKLAINARPSFVDTDQVAVGYSKADATPVQMSINVVQKEGIFANNQTPIYLHDTLLNTYHNFVNGAYSFTTSSQVDNSRFKIVYNYAMLNSDTFDNISVNTSLIDNMLHINAFSPIKEVLVFDITGRLILNHAVNGVNSYNTSFNQPRTIYILKVILDDGQQFTSKLINNK